MTMLPSLLSVMAGSADTIGFLGLGGLFTCHITGNIVILAARLVDGGQAPIAHLLSVPVFIAMLGMARVVAEVSERLEVGALRPLLLLQFLLLSGFLALGVAAGRFVDPEALLPILAGMLGVSAMAVQNALVQICLSGVPSTAVMTTNVTRFVTDIGNMVLGRTAEDVAKARGRALRTFPTILGFVIGCGLGAAGQAAFGLWAVALPTGLALLALTLGLSIRRTEAPRG